VTAASGCQGRGAGETQKLLEKNDQMNLEIVQLKEKFEKVRWPSQVKHSANYNVPLPDKGALWNKLLTSFLGGFKCAYCKHLLKINDSPPLYEHVFSIDHKISLDDGGDNSTENLEIVCHRCNIIKGTIRYDTFQDMVSILPSTLLDRMFKEMRPGRIRSKLDREERFK